MKATVITLEDKKLVLANVDMKTFACGGLKVAKWIIETFPPETALAIITWLTNTLECE